MSSGRWSSRGGDVDVQGDGAGLARGPARGEPAAVLEHEAVDLEDAAGLLGDVDEVARRHAAALGVVPAHERLGGGHVARGELDDRLQLDDQLAALGRALEVLLEAVAAQDGGVHRRLEDLVALLAGVLGRVHGDVGVAQQLLGAVDLGRPAARRCRGSRAPRSRARRPRTGARAVAMTRSATLRDVLGVADVVQRARRTRRRRAARRGRRPCSAPSRRPATASSSSSPIEWPSESLIVLKSSRSRKRTASSRRPERQQLAEPVAEQRAVGQAGQRVVEGLVLEAALQLAQLGTRCSRRSYSSETLAWLASVPKSVRSWPSKLPTVLRLATGRCRRRASRPGAPRASRAARRAGQGRVEERIGQRALEQPCGRVAVDQRVQGIGHVAVGEHHRLDRPALLDRRAQRLGALVGGQQDDLGQVAAEDVERALQQARDAGGDVGRAREQARDLVQELEALVLAPLGHVGAVGEDDGRGRDDEQHGRARVGGHRRRAAERQARVGDAHRRGHGQGAHELGEGDGLTRETDDRAHQQRTEDRVGQRGQQRGAPHAGLDDGVGSEQRVEDRRGEGAAQPEERDVEGDLDRRLPAVDDQHDDRPEQDAEQHRPRLGEDEPEDQRQLARARRCGRCGGTRRAPRTARRPRRRPPAATRPGAGAGRGRRRWRTCRRVSASALAPIAAIRPQTRGWPPGRRRRPRPRGACVLRRLGPGAGTAQPSPQDEPPHEEPPQEEPPQEEPPHDEPPQEEPPHEEPPHDEPPHFAPPHLAPPHLRRPSSSRRG